MRNNAEVDIIICTYNNANIIADCLNSIKSQTFKKCNCYVVDDGSKDNTVSIIRNHFSWVKLIVNKNNIGPSINRNIGIKKSKSRFILTLDSDVILQKNWIAKQLKLIKSDHKIGILGSKLAFYDDKNIINSAGGSLTTVGIGFDRGRGSNISNYNKVEEVIYVCSAAMMLRRSMINLINDFDETFFYGHEDTDLGWRANIFGYKVVYNPNALAYHYVSMTMKNYSSKVYYYATKNRIRSIIKNYEFRNILLYLPLLLILIIGELLFKKYRLVKLRAILWNIFNIKDTLKARNFIQNNRIKKDRDIKKLLKPWYKVFMPPIFDWWFLTIRKVYKH